MLGQLTIPYEKVSPTDWRYIYEKYVGQILEKEGFAVTYNGFRGFKDHGVDLLAKKGNSVTLIQCKFSETKKLGKSHIDQILHKASKKLLQEYQNRNKKLAFALFVHSKVDNFRRKAPKEFVNPYSNPNNTDHPWLQYFLSRNYTKSKVKVGFREIPMIT